MRLVTTGNSRRLGGDLCSCNSFSGSRMKYVILLFIRLPGGLKLMAQALNLCMLLLMHKVHFMLHVLLRVLLRTL